MTFADRLGLAFVYMLALTLVCAVGWTLMKPRKS